MKKSSLMKTFNARYPEPVAVVVTMDPQRKRPDIAAQGWFMFVSFVPPMLAVSIANTHYTHEIITDTGEFVLALPNIRQVEAVYFCGTKSGRQHDKFKESGFKSLPAAKVRPPLIAEACANFECRVAASLPAGDHTIFVGEIVQSYIAEDCRNRLFARSDGQFTGFKI